MGADDNIKTVQAVYEAFGRGDVAFILDAVTDDVDWASEASSTAAPWYGVRHGKAGVGEFFQAFGTTMEVEEFTPMTFGANDDEVFAIVRFKTKALATGKRSAMNLHHWFTFRDGKIAMYRGTEDTIQTVEALKA